MLQSSNSSKMTKTVDNISVKAARDSGEEAEHEPGMRVGEEYQADIPNKLKDHEEDKPDPVQVWAPCQGIGDVKLDEYLRISKDKHGYNMEQALGMLYWHKYNVDKSLEDLQNFTPLPDEWSMEDKVIFEQSFSSYGKSFAKIKAQLPDKSIGSLVKYYYSWKKIRNRTSLMDRQARRLSAQKHIGNFGAEFSDESDVPDDDSDSDFEPEKESTRSRVNNGKSKNISISQQMHNQISSGDVTRLNNVEVCFGCSAHSNQLQKSPKGLLCPQCFQFWRQTNVMRPKVTILQGNNATQPHKTSQGKQKKKVPKGMILTHDNLITVSQMHGDSHVHPLEINLINLRRQMQTQKQSLLEQKHTLDGDSDVFRLPEMSTKVNLRWTNEELLMAVQCVRKYGKDFQAMAEVLGNKNISQCKNFFVNYRRRFNLHDVLEEYEKENSLPRSDKSIANWDSVIDDNMGVNENEEPQGSPGSNSLKHDNIKQNNHIITNGMNMNPQTFLGSKHNESPLPHAGSPLGIVSSSAPTHPPPLVKPITNVQ